MLLHTTYRSFSFPILAGLHSDDIEKFPIEASQGLKAARAADRGDAVGGSFKKLQTFGYSEQIHVFPKGNADPSFKKL